MTALDLGAQSVSVPPKGCALKRIPEPKEKYDPWAVTRTPDADKNSSK